MKVQRISNNTYKPNFDPGNVMLYTDFDGTLIPQSIKGLYSKNKEKRTKTINNFNKYFEEIQHFIDSTNGKFDIVINTGRRLQGNRNEGFESVHRKIKSEGIKFPKTLCVITNHGGDIHYFTPDGAIDKQPYPVKATLIQNITGWNNDKIKKVLDSTAKTVNTGYRLVDKQGSYNLSIAVQDRHKVKPFFNKMNELLEREQITYFSGIKDVITTGKIKVRGIKVEPNVNGHKLHKSFDTKVALGKAVRFKDFLIVAGDGCGDRDALNIFKYIVQPQGEKAPRTIDEVSKKYLKLTKDKVDVLPLKLLFIKPKDGSVDKQTKILYDFMKKTSKWFPKKVQIVERTQMGKENYFLAAVKRSIIQYTKENPTFAKDFGGNLASRKSTPKQIALGVSALLSTVAKIKAKKI